MHLVFSFDDRELALSLFVLLNDFTKHVDIAFKVGHLDSDNGRRTLKVLDSYVLLLQHSFFRPLRNEFGRQVVHNLASDD